jgi:hypothetical protein
MEEIAYRLRKENRKAGDGEKSLVSDLLAEHVLWQARVACLASGWLSGFVA